jgi:hypothetical protein
VTVSQNDDPLWDAIALVEAAIGDDPLGCGAILRNMDAAPVVVNLAKLLSEAVADNAAGRAVCPCHFREWSMEAITRA